MTQAMWSRIVASSSAAAAYAFLDALSFIPQFSPLGITPWNPPAGLALAFMLLYGRPAIVGVFVGGLAADIFVRHLAPPFAASVATSSVTAGIYWLTADVLKRKLRMGVGLDSLRDVFFLLCAAVLAAGVVALAYVEIYAFADTIAPDRIVPAALRYWIGDMIGIAVTAPLALVLSARLQPLRRTRFVLSRWEWGEAAAQAGAVIAVLWLIFGLEDTDEFRFFYLMFLPMMWVAARFGIVGAVVGNAWAQVGLIVAFLTTGHSSTTVTAFQFLTLAVTVATLVLGAAVAERRRIEQALHARRGELAQFARLSMAGELAAALAHEVNQPLAATIAYTRAAQKMMTSDPSKADQAIGRAVGEAQRAGDIIRSLREFIGRDRIQREQVDPVRLIADSVALVAPDCNRLGVRLLQNLDKGLPPLHVDKVQMQQVLLNLIRNAVESVSRQDNSRRDIEISAQHSAGRIVFTVRDFGAGVSDEAAERLFEPFNTSKADGMGLGLSISRTLVEAHGGRLWWEPGSGAGAAFRFSVPVSKAGQGEQA